MYISSLYCIAKRVLHGKINIQSNNIELMEKIITISFQL